MARSRATRPAFSTSLATKVGGPRGGARLESRLPEIINEVPDRARELALALCKETAAIAKTSAPVESGRLKESLDARLLERGEDAAVTAEWYWFFVEFGTEHSAARPFLYPAFEQAHGSLPFLAREKFSSL